ncbi:hypothetical protein RJT34_22718 [Clitoria ternatea]|uniref:OTU domain-containing protein n=1 Tax=Clitoria ternatea TaxID=43366 RepID=A0AAN9IEA0_CLITE
MKKSCSVYGRLLEILNTKRFIEGDFDAYVKRIQQPYVWGGELELLMASHVLKWELPQMTHSISTSTANELHEDRYVTNFNLEKSKAAAIWLTYGTFHSSPLACSCSCSYAKCSYLVLYVTNVNPEKSKDTTEGLAYDTFHSSPLSCSCSCSCSCAKCSYLGLVQLMFVRINS